jgi:hypothetical protein
MTMAGKDFCDTNISLRVYNRLLTLLRDYSVSGKQVHDVNTVAVMLANRIDILLS